MDAEIWLSSPLSEMQFNVARLLKGPSGTSRSYAVDTRLPPDGDTRADHVWGSVRLMSTDAGIWVNGSLKATVACTCSRCLEPFSAVVKVVLNETYYPTIDVHTGTSVAPPEDAEPDCAIDDHHQLDITEAVRQGIVVTLPMKPLCRSDCAGLCQKCGANLNFTPCTCPRGSVDPRWGPLLKLAP
ncbi:MAG: DUF177 domain-containing protein [Chloroflexi bacterium]|nr:DUF177 domain-containing protein [Chloroflexota bacterium]